jgi:hypothetical protein
MGWKTLREKMFDFTIIRRSRLQRRDEEIRRLRQHLRIEGAIEASTRTRIETEIYTLFSHLDRYLREEIDEERVRPYLEHFANDVLAADVGRIYVHEGLGSTKHTFSVDENLQGRPLQRLMIFKAYGSASEAEREEYVSFPAESKVLLPISKRVGRFRIEDKIIGYSMFEVFDQLNRLGRAQDDSVAAIAAELKQSLLRKLLEDQAWFQATQRIPDRWLVPADTGNKLVAAVRSYLPLRDASPLLLKIGEYLDSRACVPYRDAWLFNSRLEVRPLLSYLDLPAPDQEEAGQSYPGLIGTFVKRIRDDGSLADCTRLLVDAVYQIDFERKHLATKMRDRLHILRSAVSDLSPGEQEAYDLHFSDCYARWGGEDPLPTENLGIALFNNHLRCARAFREKPEMQPWRSCQEYHLRGALDALRSYPTGEVITPAEQGTLQGLLEEILAINGASRQ